MNYKILTISAPEMNTPAKINVSLHHPFPAGLQFLVKLLYFRFMFSVMNVISSPLAIFDGFNPLYEDMDNKGYEISKGYNGECHTDSDERTEDDY